MSEAKEADVMTATKYPNGDDDEVKWQLLRAYKIILDYAARPVMPQRQMFKGQPCPVIFLRRCEMVEKSDSRPAPRRRRVRKRRVDVVELEKAVAELDEWLKSPEYKQIQAELAQLLEEMKKTCPWCGQPMPQSKDSVAR